MNPFPEIYTTSGGKKATNARLLYSFLELSESQFNRWAKVNITENKFATEGIDYQQFDSYVELHNGAKRLVEDFALSISFAKKLAMVSESPKGNLVREYFLACEQKALQQTVPSYAIDDPIARAEQWIQEAKEKQALAFQLAELKPQAEYAQKVLQSDSTLTTTKIAQELGMTAQALNKLLKDRDVQYKQSGIWNLKAKYNGKGYARLSTHAFTDNRGNARTEHLLVWTELGRQFINSLLNPTMVTETAYLPSVSAQA